jgi:DNA-binding response OmpR family regulator
MKNRHILLVDNERRLIECLKLFLELEGFTVTAAESGEEALEKAVQIYKDGSCIDLLITDILMPGMSGVDLLEKLDQNNIKPVSLGISGFCDEETMEDLKKCGCRNFLSKPFDPDEILAKITELINRSRPEV